MLQAIVGNASAEKVLLFMAARQSGYAREIAQTFDTDVTPVKNQLERMERDGMLVFERVGRTKVYQFNPRFAFVNEVKALGKKSSVVFATRLTARITPQPKAPTAFW